MEELYLLSGEAGNVQIGHYRQKKLRLARFEGVSTRFPLKGRTPFASRKTIKYRFPSSSFSHNKFLLKQMEEALPAELLSRINANRSQFWQ